MPKNGPNKRKRVPKFSFTETQGIGWHVSFRDPQTGWPTRHRFGIREKGREPEARVAYHRWRHQYGGMKAAEAKRLKALEQENARLKKLVANLLLDKQILDEALQGKW